MRNATVIACLDAHFNYLDRIIVGNLTQGDQGRRGPAIMALPELDRNLYFVYDVIAITCDAGMGAWIHYHIDDERWIDDAVRAFEAIGHHHVGEGLNVCRGRYLAANGDPESFTCVDLSEPVWNDENQILGDLHRHLVDSGFKFQLPQARKPLG